MTGKICGTGSWAPDRVWDNNDLAKMVETSDQWIRERTGVVQRHIAKEDEDTVTMAAGAALKALEDAEMKAEEIDLILVATISPTEIMPCVACGVQERLGAEKATCFDLNGACTGSLLALNTAQAYLAQGIYRNALVIGAEKLSGLTDWTDRGTCILFGDGAGAVVLRAEEGGSYAQVTHSIGKKGGALTLQSRNQIRYENDPKAKETYIQMNGKEVFSFAVSKVPEAVKELLSREHVSCEDIGRVKIPALLRKYTGKQLEFDHIAGLDRIERPITDYALIIQCGGCMITATQLRHRLQPAIDARIPVSNYGMTIAWLQGIFDRATQVFTCYRPNPSV